MSKVKLFLTTFSLICVIGFAVWQVTKPEKNLLLEDSQNWNMKSVPGDTDTKPDASNVSVDFTKKILDLETYLHSNPTDTTHMIMLARLYQDGHKPEKAVEMYQNVLELHKSNAQIWLDLINSYGMIGNWTDAAKTCESMLIQFPDNTAAMYNLGAIYANQGNNSGAVLWWNKIVQLEKIDEHVKHLAQQGLTKIAASK